jgi:hypothetical protein
MFQRVSFIYALLAALPAFAVPKYHPGIACVLSATNANAAEGSYKVAVTGTSSEILAPETVSIRVERLGDEFKIRIVPHYEMMDYTPQLLEFRVPNKMNATLSGGGVPQATFRLVDSRFRNGLYSETRLTDGNKDNWKTDQMGYVFEYRVVMRSPIEVDSVTFIVSDKEGNIVESSSWEILDEQTLN